MSLGWLNKIGVEEENRRTAVYAFFHPTFQEYFASLAIYDWHFFLNHIPGNPLQPDASYFAFEQPWREVFLLWLGNQHISNSLKEELLGALMNFDDGFGKPDFYRFRAKLLAASSLVEFQSFSKKQEVTDWILNLSISQIETFNNPTANSARNLLKEIPCSVLAETFSVFLRCENVHLQHDAAKLVGELKCSDSRVVNALEYLALTTEFKDTRCDALCSLLEIDSTNVMAIDGLIQILYSQGIDATLAIPAAQALRYAEIQKEKVIQNLENFIQPQFLEKTTVLLPPQL
ncbi:hypothetical protein VB780_03170 [Leptolyngbya sp. CCNP1308]|uniref:hypothetical protein n=1 Tax=Leptolyngbya sp. CCNP1308 TaxID=3110255 RepID=UPI002B20440E|nr:hypothetical protein [Leptolyngbya sp. CCNP1308]MEA5447555.1 hypothetical protein [Leptolyngbya sp. CCNP1308]